MSDYLIIVNIIVSALSPMILSLSFCLKRFKKSKCRDCEVETESENYPEHHEESHSKSEGKVIDTKTDIEKQ